MTKSCKLGDQKDSNNSNSNTNWKCWKWNVECRQREATKRRNNNEIVAINYDMICDQSRREWARHRGAGQEGSLGTAETHLMRLTLVDVKSLPGWGSWLGCTTAILGTTAIDKEKHTHTHTGTGFWFPKKQKKKKQSGEQAIPKRVLQSDRQQLVAATVQRVLISFYWENCGCSETAPTTTTPPTPLSPPNTSCQPLPHSLCLWFVIQINRKKEEQQQQQEGKQLCEQLKLFDDIERWMGQAAGYGRGVVDESRVGQQ